MRGRGSRTLGDVVSEAPATTEQTVVHFQSREAHHSRSVAELLEEAQLVAGGLRRLGVGPGDRVATQLPNCEEQFALQVASVVLGAVFVPIVPVFGAAELGAILADARPDVLVVRDQWRGSNYLTRVSELDAELRPRHVIVSGTAGGDTLPYQSLREYGTVRDLHPSRPDDVALVIYTSGSTGKPKGVEHTHRSILAEAAEPQYVDDGPAGSEPRQLQATGAGHIGGYMYVIRILASANRVLVLDWWDTKVAVEAIARHRIGMFAGTPYHLAAMLDAAAERSLDISCLKQVVIGGAPVSPHLIERADAAGVVAVRSYGLSEHPTVATGRFNADLDERANFEGRPGEGSEIRIVDATGEALPVGEPGEILTRGPDLARGYTNVADEDAFAAGGWLRTGDIGKLDAEGRLTLVDRKRNMIIRGGENLSIAEIELALARHPGVSEVAVVGVPDERYGERVCAFVVPRGIEKVTLETVAALFAQLGLAKQKIPEYLEVVDALPTGGLQKVRRHELRRLFIERRRAMA